jgi:branched-chain amino acid aminotransferase
VSIIRSVDRIPVGDGEPGPIARRLQNELLGVAHGERPDPYGWLTHAAPVEGAKRKGQEAKVSG